MKIIIDDNNKPQIKMFGGPLDGITVPADSYFEDGDILAVDTIEHSKADATWSPESIYVYTGGRLVYNAAITKKRREIVAKGE